MGASEPNKRNVTLRVDMRGLDDFDRLAVGVYRAAWVAYQATALPNYAQILDTVSELMSSIAHVRVSQAEKRFWREVRRAVESTH